MWVIGPPIDDLWKQFEAEDPATGACGCEVFFHFLPVAGTQPFQLSVALARLVSCFLIAGVWLI